MGRSCKKQQEIVKKKIKRECKKQGCAKWGCGTPNHNPNPIKPWTATPNPNPNPNLSWPQPPTTTPTQFFFTIWHPNPKPNPIFFMEITTTPTTTQFYYPKTPYTQHQPNFFLKYLPQPNPNFQKCWKLTPTQPQPNFSLKKDHNWGPTPNFTPIFRQAKIGLKTKLSSMLIAVFAKLSPAQSQLFGWVGIYPNFSSSGAGWPAIQNSTF